MRHEIEVSEFSAVIQEFAAYKSAIQGCSQRTVEEYLRGIGLTGEEIEALRAKLLRP